MGEAVQAFTHERDERTVGENLGKYIMHKCAEREIGNPFLLFA